MYRGDALGHRDRELEGVLVLSKSSPSVRYLNWDVGALSEQYSYSAVVIDRKATESCKTRNLLATTFAALTDTVC